MLDTYAGCVLQRRGHAWRAYVALDGYRGTWVAAQSRKRLCEAIDAARAA